MLVEEIAEQKGLDPSEPEFCLYEETDAEALTLFLESTKGPTTVRFPVDDTDVTVEKTAEGEVTVEVESAAEQRQPLD